MQIYSTIAYSEGHNGSRAGPVDMGKCQREAQYKFLLGPKRDPKQVCWLCNPSSWRDLRSDATLGTSAMEFLKLLFSSNHYSHH